MSDTMKDSKAEPSGYKGDNPATGGSEANPPVNSNTPENAQSALKPSSPGETGTTPGTDWN